MSRAALYLDFDNVFGTLLAADPQAALAFAERPHEWLARLAEQHLIGDERRWLVRRCYINPAGSVPDPRARAAQKRLVFSRFRPFFVSAGFEVVDCPALTNRGKNAADIRLALDAMEAMISGPVRYDEFVIASGDSDCTPLLVRLRAADRRTTIIASSDHSAAYIAIADRHIRVEQTIALMKNEPDESVVSEPPANPAGPLPTASEVESAYEAFRVLIQVAYESSTTPLNMSSLSARVRSELGDVTTRSTWFGKGTFYAAVASLKLPGVERSAHELWDSRRHEPPPSAPRPQPLPDAVERLCLLFEIPQLSPEQWRQVFSELSAAASAVPGAEPSAVVDVARDALAARGQPIGRQTVGFVERACRFGGAGVDLYPAPSADELANAFVRNTLSRAEHVGVELTPEESETVSTWMGADTEAGPTSTG